MRAANHLSFNSVDGEVAWGDVEVHDGVWSIDAESDPDFLVERTESGPKHDFAKFSKVVGSVELLRR